jgi:hypothetical protein
MVTAESAGLALHANVKATSPTYHPMSWTAHRVDPVGAGGSNNGRLVPAHRTHNIQAGDCRRNRKQKAPVIHARQW